MRVLSWLQGDTGTIQAADGHVHLRNIAQQERMEAAIRKIVDDAPALPATTIYFAAALGRAGAKYSLQGSYFVFGDVPEDWDLRYALDPVTDPNTPPPAPLPIPDAYTDFSDEELSAMATAAGLNLPSGAVRSDIIGALETANQTGDIDAPDSTQAPATTQSGENV